MLGYRLDRDAYDDILIFIVIGFVINIGFVIVFDFNPVTKLQVRAGRVEIYLHHVLRSQFLRFQDSPILGFIDFRIQLRKLAQSHLLLLHLIVERELVFAVLVGMVTLVLVLEVFIVHLVVQQPSEGVVRRQAHQIVYEGVHSPGHQVLVVGKE